MSRMRVFIASAGRAVPLANALKTEMDELDEPWDVFPWFSPGSAVQHLGPSILEELITECKQVHLAVILLTEDDLHYDLASTPASKVLVPRPNCVFEAGLFMGGLGLDPRRSVIVTSVKHSVLPSDLQSVHYVQLDSSVERGDEQFVATAMKEVATRLQQHVRTIGEPPRRPFLPVYLASEVVDRERSRTEGGDIDAGQKLGVIVNTVQPVETKLSLARQVTKNMEQGVEYRYFFRADPNRITTVARLLQSLVLTRLDQLVPDNIGDDERVKLIAGNADKAVSAVEEIRPRLRIHFLPKEQLPLYFCVHNALDPHMARCYLRHGAAEREGEQIFVRWAEGEAAYNIAMDLLNLARKKDEEGIFYPTRDFELYGSEPNETAVLDSIKRGLKEYFSPQVFARIRQSCFL